MNMKNYTIKVLTFPAKSFDKEQLDMLNEKGLIKMATEGENSELCVIYNTLAEYQEAQNTNFISNQCYIYFVLAETED